MKLTPKKCIRKQQLRFIDQTKLYVWYICNMVKLMEKCSPPPFTTFHSRLKHKYHTVEWNTFSKQNEKFAFGKCHIRYQPISNSFYFSSFAFLYSFYLFLCHIRLNTAYHSANTIVAASRQTRAHSRSCMEYKLLFIN